MVQVSWDFLLFMLVAGTLPLTSAKDALKSPRDRGLISSAGKRADSGAPDVLVNAFQSASWIWTTEQAPPNAPQASRAFRKTFTTPSGKAATSALVLMTVDNYYTLYLNGQEIGSSQNATYSWQTAQLYKVPLLPNSNLFAIRGTNFEDNGPAGLLIGIQITFSNGDTSLITSDASWRSNKVIPDNFQSPSTDDSQWPTAAILGKYGSQPWGTTITIPTVAAEIIPSTTSGSTTSSTPTIATQPGPITPTITSFIPTPTSILTPPLTITSVVNNSNGISNKRMSVSSALGSTIGGVVVLGIMCLVT